MKSTFFILILLLITLNAWALPPETLQRLKKIYPDQSESLLLSRVNSVDSKEGLWRSFPPYFYEMVTRIELPKDFLQRLGMCAGDAHFQNFGFLFNDKPHFTINDLDDVSLCPLNLDAMRSYLSHLMIDDFSTADWLKAYEAGLKGTLPESPKFIRALEKESLDEGKKLPKKIKNLISDGCQNEFASVSDSEEELVSQYLKSEGQVALKICSRIKATGGSAALKRFVAIYGKAGKESALELKPLINPAPLWNISSDASARKNIINEGITAFLGNSFKSDYFGVVMGGQVYLRQPLWSGNTKVDKSSVKKDDRKNIILYEAQILGSKHRLSNSRISSINAAEWDALGKVIMKKWDAEFP